jgi:hypothetical protein
VPLPAYERVPAYEKGTATCLRGAAAYERVPKGTATCLRGAAAYERVPILEQGTAACFVAASCGLYLSCVTAFSPCMITVVC